MVKTSERRLYLILDYGHAMRYPVGVGKSGKQWAGTTQIDGKYRNPAWAPPSEVKRDKPSIPDVIPGGSRRNPMGVAALTLAGGHTPSTVPTCRARSAASCPTAASAC